jgi:intein/homing endonuclease
MVKRGISGGMLSVVSLLKDTDRTVLMENALIKTSSSIKQAAKVGLQSLYANADEVLERYKDFDIIKEMKARKGANLLWVRARAIDANIVNTNGDYFSEEELTKEMDYQGKKMPAYKTFEGVPIYTNHKNDNIEEAKGMVVYAEWDDEEKCVYCVFFIDEDAYPEIARGVRQAYIRDVSMGCFDGNTKIPTSNGFKKIIDVNEKDQLFDTNGNLVDIVNSQEYDHFEKIHLVTLEGGHQIKCTDYHPFLTFTKEQWNERKSLKRPKDTNGKKLSKWVENEISPDYIRLENLKPGDVFLSPIGGTVIEDEDFNKNRAKLIGYFLAEGSYDSNYHRNRIHLTFNISEKDTYAQEVVDLIREEFNLEAKIRVPKAENYCRVSITNENLKNWFFDNCGRWSSKKKLNAKWLMAPYDIQKSIIGAWIDGDGTSTLDKRNGNIYLRVTTISVDLFDQMSFILSRLGIFHSCYFSYKNKRFDYIDLKSFEDFHPQCIIQIPSYSTCELEGYLHKTICSSALNKNKHTYKNFLARRIISIEEIPIKQQKVYTFQTQSGNYLAHNFISKNCSVDLGKCSICGNEATTEKDYCSHLKNYKGKNDPVSGKKAFEYNFGIKFIELSCVGDGAFESCEILELYDQDELLQKAKDTIKTAQSLNSSITLAASLNENIQDKRDVEQALRQLRNLNYSIIKIAQTAGTLVGGQLLGGAGSQNATVVKILQGLGIDPSSSLNILDLVNLALNFLEVAVLNLFSRKDNIDLAHVAKLTKAMGELQNTLQDMIDDGIESADSKNTQPMIPPQNGGEAPQQPPAGAQPAAPGAQPVPPAVNATLEQPSVGTMVSPFAQTPYVMPIGGGVSADSKNLRFIWASNDEPDEIELKETKLSKLSKLVIALDNLREACQVPKKNNNEVVNDFPQKNKTSASSGENNIMDQFKKIAQDYKKQNSVALAIDIKLGDNSGNRVVLSTDKGIKGYHQGRLTNWSPNLTDAQLAQMENGDGYRVAGDLLEDFSKVVKTATAENKIDALVVMNESLEPEKTEEFCAINVEIENDHAPKKETTYEESLSGHRKKDELLTPFDEKISEKRTKELVRIVTELSKDAKAGLGKQSLEDMLHPNFAKSALPGREIMSNVIKGIAKTCQKTSSKPEDVINFLTKFSTNEMGRLLKVARLGTKVREYGIVMGKFAQANPPTGGDPGIIGGMGNPDALPPDMGEEAIKDVADSSDTETSEGDIIEALKVIADNFETAASKLKGIIGTEEDGRADDMKDALTEEDADKDALKGAVTGLSLAGEESGASPDELVNNVNSMPADEMASGISSSRTPFAASERAKRKAVKTASKADVKSNIIGWLADMADHHGVSSEKITLAAKLFCSYGEPAKVVLAKAIRKSDVQVVDETTHATTITCTLDDIGTDVKDAAFNQKFRDFAVQLLSTSGYEVDPTTFALTEIIVSEDGTVQGKVSTKATKYFSPESPNESMSGLNYVDEDRIEKSVTPSGPIPGELIAELPISQSGPSEPNVGEIIMSASAKSAKRLARMNNIMRLAQFGMPGGTAAPAAAAGAAPTDPTGGMGAGMAGGPADLGLGSLTGGDESAPSDSPINDSPEPGTKSPWGTICPQCGSKDVDVANGEGTCNSCNAQLKYKFIVEVAGGDEQNQEGPDDAMADPAAAPMPPVGGPAGSGEVGLDAGFPPAGAAPAPAAPAMASSRKVMTKIAYRTSADVYVEALSENFDKLSAHKLPAGMICPACSSRTASRHENKTYCYDCGTISVTEKIKRVKGEPGVLEANIFWIS